MTTHPILFGNALAHLAGASPGQSVEAGAHAHAYLEEDVHVLPGRVLFEHRVGVFSHHVVDGFDYVHHLLEGDMEAKPS